MSNETDHRRSDLQEPLLAELSNSDATAAPDALDRPSDDAGTPWNVIVAAALGAGAAWVAAGSVGLIGHPLRAGLTWLLMGGMLLAVLSPGKHRDRPGSRIRLPLTGGVGGPSYALIVILLGTILAVAMTASRLQTVNLLAIPALLSLLAATESGSGRAALKAAAEATFVLALYRLAITSLPIVWLAADGAGGLLGSLAGGISGCPLWVGASFAGLDFLVVMFYLVLRAPPVFSRRGLLIETASRVRARLGSPAGSGETGPGANRESAFKTLVLAWGGIAVALLAVLLLHVVFLSLVSHGARWHADLPRLPVPDPDDVNRASPREAVHTIRNLVPWNIPTLAAVAYAVFAGAYLWWWTWLSRRLPTTLPRQTELAVRLPPHTSGHKIPWPAVAAVLVLLAVGVPMWSLPGWPSPVSVNRSPAGEDRENDAAASLDSDRQGSSQPERPSTEGVERVNNAAASLDGKKIVVFEKGYLNWMKPVHGDYGAYSVGMYGLLPVYLESLGANCVVSPDLSEEDLRDADLLILIFPDDPWQEGQLERIWDYVRGGGSLLLMGEHTVRKRKVPAHHLFAVVAVMGEHTVRKRKVPWEKRGNHFNEVLQPTAMEVRFDSATFEVGGWLQSYQPLAHPTTAGIRDNENEFGTVIGASVATRWPARPLLVGRWGWADPGEVVPVNLDQDAVDSDDDDASKMGNGQYDPGEKLGDLVLAAEQPLGKGKVIVFGDTSCMTNGLTVGCHPFTSRLLAYAADARSQPAGLSSQLYVLLMSILLATMLAWRREVWLIALVSVVCSLAFVIQTSRVHADGEILPDANKLKAPHDMLQSSVLDSEQPSADESPPDAGAIPPDDNVRPYGLAYIDASHLHAYSPEGWRDDGVMGLCLTLMRSGYLTLMLPEVTAERLRGADVLVSVAPSREYNQSERDAIEDFVCDGGTLICMIGRDRYQAGRSLLEQLRFRVGHSDWNTAERDEPIPCSHFKSPYFQGEDYEAFVRFDAAWPIACLDDPSKRLMITERGGLMPNDRALRLIEVRRLRKGLIAVIGDTGFGMNKNLEREDGTPFEGLRENADFWRWFMDLLRTGEPQWIPPYSPPPEFYEPGSSVDELGGAAP